MSQDLLASKRVSILTCVTLSNPRLRLDEFDRLTQLRGWHTDAQRSRGMGISQELLSRIRRGKSLPGAAFIHRVMTVLQVPYPLLFAADDDEYLLSTVGDDQQAAS